MKKVLTVLFAVLLTLSFTGCPKMTGSTGDEDKKEPVTYIGTKSPAEARSKFDIVFNDGSAVAYSEELTLTDEQKAAAIAVIYKVTDSKAYGIGIVYVNDHIAWCLDSAEGLNRLLEDIVCKKTEDFPVTFEGDTDGSDNFERIKEALGYYDDTETLSNYPAFEFAINYKDKEGSHVSGTAYESGWYLPSLPELWDLYRVSYDLDLVLRECGCTNRFDGSTGYWSSTQPTPFSEYAGRIWFLDGKIGYLHKPDTSGVCCIRVFE